MMIKLTYFVLMGIVTVILLAAIVYYLIKPAPTDDTIMGWAVGVVYVIALVCILVIGMLLWRHKGLGIIILCLPTMFVIIPAVQSAYKNVYAWLPISRNIPLTVHVANNTRALVNVKLECWFGDGDQQSLFKTLEFTSRPLAVNQHLISDYDTRLLNSKSAFVRIALFECIQESGSGYSYVRELQPCMQFRDVPVKDFRVEDYLITIDEEKNSDAFKSEVIRLKKEGMYKGGVF